MDELRAEFARVVEAAIQECHRIKYTPTIWERMNRQYGPVDASVRLVTSGDFQAGFRRLLAENRPELTVESLMLQPKFSVLFDSRILELAQWRLNSATR